MHSRGLYLQTEDESTVEILMEDIEGKENKTEPVSPSDDLVRVLEYDYSEYRSGIRKLRNEHPLLEESLDVSILDYEDFLAVAFELPERIREFDPIGYFVVVSRLASILRIPDDNSASFLLNNAQRILSALEEPLLTQIRLRNIFEVGFADMERATQKERYTAVRNAYPQLFQHYFSGRHLPAEEGDMPFGKRKEYVVQSLLELRLLELEMYFRQQKRIARCLHCWNYFIPRTNRETLYCDRVFDGRNCKTLGPLAQRRIDQHNDNALTVFETLRHRMASRAERFRDGGEDMTTDYAIDTIAYGEWSDLARRARMEYLDGKITAEEFIKTIDIYGDFPDFYSQKNAPMGENIYKQRVANDIDFDSEQRYFPIQTLILSEDPDQNPPPEWTITSASEWQKREQGGSRSLMDLESDLPEKEDKRRRKTE